MAVLEKFEMGAGPFSSGTAEPRPKRFFFLKRKSPKIEETGKIADDCLVV